ncbi:peptidase C39 family protein [Deinococcus taeanensis]|uniref:peptidase C39 family protein n=1 Tax=Deinococcus taeanensis TaxID=2737050 RepID=UPI001CDC4FBD|nr:peptidase C39 family protein [Deinococcus taeanensis]UBV42066.1 peptidase C39 family protein [Deinococcus taeanensis]
MQRTSLLLVLAAVGAAGLGRAEALTMTYPHSSTVIHERAADWAGGEGRGITAGPAGLTLAPGVGSGTFTSAPVRVAAFDELVPSWNAVTPARGSVSVEVRVQAGGTWTRWYSFGSWSAAGDRASLDGQRDAAGQVLTDTLRLNAKASTYQYRVTLRGAGTALKLVALNTSDRARRSEGLGAPGNRAAWGREVKVPTRSQMLYPNGGEVWCSPTSVSMILAHYGVNVSVPDAAQGTFDRVYDGTGNWPFNAAYAGTWGLRAVILRLPSLAEAEKFTAAGTPLAVSLGWKAGELPGAAIASSTGHLMVLTGFDAKGNPVLNDPAAPTDAGVRRTYPRAVFERLWLAHSGGLTYLITPQVD